MAKKKGVRITILVEDRRLDVFTRRTLEALGYDRHRLYVEPDYPRGGRGSGKQWVDDNYPDKVRKLRQKIGSQKVALLVGTDADEMTVEQRAGQLAATLESAKLKRRGDDEPIAHWIPKRNIETWGLVLTDAAVGVEILEDQSYKNTPKARDIDWKKAATAFVDAYRRYTGESHDAALPSLRMAYSETRRLENE